MEKLPTHAVLNCHVTAILGLYDTEAKATEAAETFGRCSFAYPLSEAESAALAVAP